MDAKIFKFYQAFKFHEFTEEQMEDVVEGIKVITRDESRDHTTKADLERLSEKMDKRTDEIKSLIYDKYTAIVLWVVSTGIAITGLIIAVTKLL